MPYVTYQDFLAICDANELATLSPYDTADISTELESCIFYAISVAKTKLDHRFNFDAIISGTPEPMLARIICHLALFERYMSVEPRAIPDLRVKAKDDALMQLTRFGNGKDTAPMEWTRKAPQTGMGIQWGHDYTDPNTGLGLPKPDLTGF